MRHILAFVCAFMALTTSTSAAPGTCPFYTTPSNPSLLSYSNYEKAGAAIPQGLGQQGRNYIQYSDASPDEVLGA